MDDSEGTVIGVVSPRPDAEDKKPEYATEVVRAPDVLMMNILSPEGDLKAEVHRAQFFTMNLMTTDNPERPSFVAVVLGTAEQPFYFPLSAARAESIGTAMLEAARNLREINGEKPN